MIEDFAVFIMVWGRPEKDLTYKSLRKQGYTGKIYLVADNLDEKVPEYREKYGDDLLVFNKQGAYDKYDSGDNSGDMRSTLYSANTIPELAKEKGLKYFMIACDDYTHFDYRYIVGKKLMQKTIKNLDSVIEQFLVFLENTNTLSIAFAQAGDFIGGSGSANANKELMRKAMNTFICKVGRRFEFVGRMNEDVTTYVNVGSKGGLFFSLPLVVITQKEHQAEKGGLTDMYLDYGTYVKSFFSVMYNPSCVKVGEMGEKHRRIHHKISWKNAVPEIVHESLSSKKTKLNKGKTSNA